MKLKAIAILLSLSSMASAGNVIGQTQTQALPGYGVKSNSTSVSCNHSATVTNTTGAPVTVKAWYTICVEAHGCEEHPYTIKVNVGTWHDTYQTHMRPTFWHGGHFRLECSTDIEGVTQSARSADYADVTITE